MPGKRPARPAGRGKTTRKITERARRFAQEYPRDLNSTRAAERAGYSPKGAHTEGYRLLRHPEVADLIAQEVAKVREKLQASTADVLERLTQIAMVDPAQLFDENNNLLSIHDIPLNSRVAIASYKIEAERVDQHGNVTRGEVRELKLRSVEKCLELLGRYHKLFVDVVELHGTEELMEQMRRARARAGMPEPDEHPVAEA